MEKQKSVKELLAIRKLVVGADCLLAIGEQFSLNQNFLVDENHIWYHEGYFDFLASS